MSTRALSRWRYGALAAVLAVGVLLRFWGIGWGLQNANVSTRPHPDEWTLYYLFQWFNSNHNLNPCPNTATQCFFDWGMVYPYFSYGLHFLLDPLFGLLPAGDFGPRADLGFVRTVLEARVISALLSSATILVAYRLASAAYGSATGLVAAALVALSALPIQLAHFGTPDSATGLLLCLSLLGTMIAWERPSGRLYLIAGVLVGAATASEFHMVLLAIPLAVAWCLTPRRRLVWLPVAAAGAILTFIVLNPYILAEFPSFLNAAQHTLRIRTVDNQLEYGARWAPYGPAWLYVVRFPLGYGVGFAITGWMLVGVLWAMIRRRPADLILLSWTVAYFVLVTVEPAKFMRYSAPLVVPLAIFGARFAIDVLSRGRAVRVACVAIGLATLAYSSLYDSAYAGLFASPDPRAVASSWVAARATPTTRVAYEEIPDGLLNLPYFLSNSVQPCIAQFRISRVAGVNFIMLDSYTPEEQQASALPAVARFRQSLASDPRYQMVEQVHYVPTFLGIKFPIDGSPHDWRYPSHVVTVYRNLAPAHPNTASMSDCFPTLADAARALKTTP